MIILLEENVSPLPTVLATKCFLLHKTQIIVCLCIKAWHGGIIEKKNA